MTDQELLLAAGKAAGIAIKIGFNGTLYAITYNENGLEVYLEWNPLTDDGDALRLAVKLGLDVRNALYTDAVYVECFEIVGVEVEYNDDPYAATRRAIVRAAAEIGKDMK